MRKLSLLILLAPFVTFSQVININQDNTNLKFANSINVEDLKTHLYTLASDSMQGRETGTIGQQMAAEYIANHFRKLGIPPYKRKTYYQEFTVKSKRHSCKCSTCDADAISKRKNPSEISGENVLGFIEGTDLKKEIIVITAHYDHLGTHDGEIFNGADDDASGTSAALEIAQAFMDSKNSGHGPRRSILIMAVSGEEKGLLGSKYYTDNPIYPLKNTITNLNIDMIGRIDEFHEDPNYVYLIGSDKLSADLHNISEEVNNKYYNIELDYTFNSEDDPNRYYYRSDHYNFAKNNIPVIFYFNGIHADYHQPSDTPDKINYEKVEKITRFVFLTAWELANRDERPKLD